MTGQNWIRRLGLAGAGLAAVGLVFAVFSWLSPSVSLPEQPVVSVPAPDLPKRSAPEAGAAADTTVELVENSRWVRRDPQTKRIIEVGGFSRLLTPAEGSAYWIVESPYLIRYEDRFVCRIDARRGRIQMEAGGQVPSSVVLQDQVVLQIQRPQTPEDTATEIFLDDLSYNSERSEFFTEGPVRMRSQEAELEGKGLMLVYNPRLSRMEYLEVRNLDYLLIKQAAGLGPENPSTPKNSSEKAPQPVREERDSETEQPTRSPISEPLYYQCSLRNDVVIQYGSRLVVAGADQVNIRQILWQRSAKGSDELSLRRPEPVQSLSNESGTASLPQSQGPRETTAAKPVKPSENEILITCKGGIVVQVAPDEESAEKKTVSAIEMIGRLQIERLAEDARTRIPMAVCSALR